MVKITRTVKTSGPVFDGKSLAPLIKVAVRDTLEYGKGVIKDATPVDTGNLQSKWFFRTEQLAIYNEVPYAPYVEDGTSKMEGQFMAQNSVPAISEYLEQAVSIEINKALN